VICGDVLPFLEHPEEADLLDKDPILGLLKWICDATENSFIPGRMMFRHNSHSTATGFISNRNHKSGFSFVFTSFDTLKYPFIIWHD